MTVAGRSAIGLDIGTSSVRAAELSFGRGKVTLDKFGQVALPDGAVRDGEVVDVPAVANAIRQLWRASKFSGRKVVVGVGNQKVIVRTVDLPWLPTAELKQSLSFQVQDFIPIPVDQASLDFVPLEEFEAASGARMIRGLLVAASRDMVSTNLAAVQKAGLTPVLVDLTSFAVLRAMGGTPGVGLDSRAEVLVDIGARVTNVIVHTNGIPRFVRILLLGGQDITDAVGERLGVDGVEAEAIKQRLGADSSDELGEVAGRAVEVATSQFVDEVRGSLDFYLATPGAVPPGRILLTGGGSRLHRLSEQLSMATRLPVELGSPVSSLRVGRTGLTPEQIEYVDPLAAVPVGLALGVAS
jgi:type IV pilus assembly protein PilM